MADPDDRRLFEHFIVAGLADGADELATVVHECGNKSPEQVAPIVDITVIFPSLGETVPKGYECIQTTPSGHPADLNHNSIRTNSAFLCYRRSYNKAPLVDIGILDESKDERVKYDSAIIQHTHYGNPANVNNGSSGLYFTTRRSQENAPPHQLVITHICVILTNKGEHPPHTYYKIDKNLNKAMVGSNVYVCYKKAQSCSKKISYKPSILDYYPKVDDISNSVALNVPMFCLPMGAVIESWSNVCNEPEKMFSTCVLTDELGRKYYGASLTFYEKYTKPLTEDQVEKLELSSLVPDDEEGDSVSTEAKYYSSKAICIVSRYPFFEPFRKFLYFVNGLSEVGVHQLPIERYISHLMLEVPFPSPMKPRVLMQLNNDLVAFESHDDSQVPLSGATFVESLKVLNPENFIYAMLLALLEQKILVHSLRPWQLTAVSETLCALMFPFHWQCPYIPQCPLELAGVLHAPLPFIAGVHSRYFDLFEDLPEDVTCFDLDTQTVSLSNVRKSVKVNILPKKPLKRLRAALERLYTEIKNKDLLIKKDSDMKNTFDLQIREEFLKFMCSLMENYTDHLRPIQASPKHFNATDTNALFNLESFIKSRDKNALEFYNKFAETQCFIRFIEERSFISDKNVYNVFFDDCVTKIKSGYTGLLMDYDAYLANHTVVVPLPEMFEKSSNLYEYHGFPTKFNAKLFESERIMKKKDENAMETVQNASDRPPESQQYSIIRTKQEVRMSLFTLKELTQQSDMHWPRSVLFFAYSLWFLQLPALVNVSRNKYKMILLGFRVLCRLEKSGVPLLDQLCYRTMIWLCGEYKYPQLAVDVLKKALKSGIILNAITYGTYHWAVMQGDWPFEAKLNAHAAFRRLRFLLETTAAFRDPIRYLQRPQLPNPDFPKAEDALSVASGTSKALDDLHLAKAESGISGSISNQSLCSSMMMSEDANELTMQPPSNLSLNEDAVSQKSEAHGLDPLGVISNGRLVRDKSSESLPTDSLSPSRAQFMKEHSTSPFSKDLDDLEKKIQEKKTFKLGGSWLKGITTSPIVSKLMKSGGMEPTDKSKGTEGSKKNYNNSLTGSPSLHSLVNQFRKHAIKGYDGVVQQSSVILKKSGLNTLIGDGKSSKSNKESSGMSTMSSSEENLDLIDPFLKDSLYQLDTGSSGDFLSMDYWMRDALQDSVTSLTQLCASTDSSLDIILSTCTPCPSCENIVYDEELMSAWQPTDSNLNSACPACSANFVPTLKVLVKERSMDKRAPSWYLPLMLNFNGEDVNKTKNESIEDELKDGTQLSVPYLSPLALRKEMEKLISQEFHALAQSSLRVSHPIIFWNLLYYCRRLDLPTHINAWISPNVHIRCVYDLPELHKTELAPMYFSREVESEHSLVPAENFTHNAEIRKLIIQALPQERGLVKILQHVVQHHRITKDGCILLKPHFSIYRDIMFVALDQFGHSVDREQFDREFLAQLDRLPSRIVKLLQPNDQIPRFTAIACRRIFLPLDMN